MLASIGRTSILKACTPVRSIVKDSAEHRQNARMRLLKGGIIAFSARHATLPCVVRDISETGARLQVKQVSSVPDTFELIVELDGLEVAAEVVWRSGSEVGIRFLGALTWVQPKRAQSISMSTPSPLRTKPTLRRDARTAEATVGKVAPDATIAAVPFVKVPPKPGLQKELPVRNRPRSISVVVCDDDPDDRMLINDAFREANFRHSCAFVENGEELLKYLRGHEPYSDREQPGLVLLDLNMPRMDGRTALMHIKSDANLKRIPVIVMTTSSAQEDIQRTYELGVSAYIPKPNNHDELLEVVEAIDKYWLRLVSLPAHA